MKFSFSILKPALYLTAISALFLLSCNAENEPVNEHIIVSVDDDYSLYFPYIQTFYSNHEFGARYPDSEFKGYEEAIDYLVTNHLMFVDFFEKEMHRDPDLEYELARIINEDLENVYFEEQYLSDYINETSINRYYQGMQKEIQFSQIVLPVQSQSAESRQELDDVIEDILDAISEGEDFSRLMNLYSREDRIAGTQSGTRVLRGDRDRTTPLFSQLYNLNEGDVKVLDTGASLLVVHIDRVDRIDAPPLENVRNDILRNLRNIHYNDIYVEFENDKNRIVNKENADWNEEALEKLTTWSAQPEFFTEQYQTVIQDEISADRDIEILSYNNSTVYLSDYLRILDTILIPQRSRGMNTEQMKNFLVEAVQKDAIVKKAREMGLDENILNANRQNPALRSRIIQIYDREIIESQIPEATDERIAEFYETNRDSLFWEPAKVNLFVHFYDTRDEAEAAWSRYQNGAEFENLESGYSVRTFIINREGNIESFMRRETPYLGEAAFSIDQGEVDGPVEFTHDQHGQQFAIIKSANREEERILEIADVENRIDRMFREYHRKEILSQVKADLWDRYPVTIYKDNLQRNIAEL
ncbi:hypothetical protein DYD21_05805 [Rhodohalobacter sp. SW132]|uniref:hypothetical protein n=1 Tax=Rhodohalobacter sp. SW132 TaxID=2293433 RepID=UPI000E248ECE|nr:hypothetical protein [Rhodohalobacter sp. SW132]REL38124.1 hypothetical protein DYD21_05805 [Rhodohalobacter sp. SW132]